MSDSEMLDWLEQNEASVYFVNLAWTVADKNDIASRNRKTLRDAIVDCAEATSEQPSDKSDIP